MYTGVDTVKIKLKKRVDELIFKIGKKRFNEWKMIWK
jgi:hypothetical protein